VGLLISIRKGAFGKADRGGTATGKRERKGGGDLPQSEDQPGVTYYVRKRQYSGVGVSELCELRQLREENGRLKRPVTDLSMDRQILQEIVSEKL
jgi:hypothetical protein